jgi:prepilin-type N-terminal cleavage/methylation domain-containing protein
MTSGRHGFTLLELMVGVFIFTLVIGSMYMTLQAGMESFQRGEESMETYQGVRIAALRIGKDVRRAVPPSSPWSNKAEEEDDMPSVIRQAERDPEDPRWQEEELENDIFFQGDSQQMTFILEESIPGAKYPFDLYEVTYTVDTEKEMLVRRINASLIQKRMFDWRAQRSENETEYRVMYSVLLDFEPKVEEIVQNVKDVEFSYYDGDEWQDYWDSNEYVDEEGAYEEEDRWDRYNEEADPYAAEEEPDKKGLPWAVRTVLTLTNGDDIRVITEVPAKKAEEFLNETPFWQRI